MAERLSVGVSPHVHGGESVQKVMWTVFLALLPAGAAGVIIFGFAALKVIIISIASCLITEFLIQKLRRKKITLYDGSAALTGLLLAYNLSSGVPFWIPLVGGIFAVAIAKHTFGGLGANIFNPALAARAFLLASWPKQMTDFYRPLSLDAVSSATPLAMLKEGGMRSLSGLGLSYGDLFLGNRPGCLGEVCALALILGAAYLLWKGYVWRQAPMGFILSLGALSWMFGGEGFLRGDFLFAILSGGLILGAFFMATDYVTTPITKKGQLVFGIGCGVITFVIR
ncbi:RnfABCDGE type electron transport complex subunit D, partial [bacterium]